MDKENEYKDKKLGKLKEDIVEKRIEESKEEEIGMEEEQMSYDERKGKISDEIGGGLWSGEGEVEMGIGNKREDKSMRRNMQDEN